MKPGGNITASPCTVGPFKPIGRFEFFGHLLVVVAITLLPAEAVPPSSIRGWIGLLIFPVGMLPATIGRLRDMRHAIAWVLVLFVPVVNIVFCILCLTERGKGHAIRPDYNKITWRKCACICCGLWLIGFFTNAIHSAPINNKNTSFVMEPPYWETPQLRQPENSLSITPSTIFQNTANEPSAVTYKDTQAEIATLKAAQQALTKELEMTKRSLTQAQATLGQQSRPTQQVATTIPPAENTPRADQDTAEALAIKEAEKLYYAAYDTEANRIAPQYPGLLNAGSPLNRAYAAQLQIANAKRDPILQDPVQAVNVLAQRATLALGLQLPPADPFERPPETVR